MINKPKYIAIEGVIGVGKTSFAQKLSEKLNSKLILEDFKNNTFLDDFYNNRAKYAFQTQMFFLISRYQQLKDLYQEDLFSEFVISDYIFEKDRLFAHLNLTKEELNIYDKLYFELYQHIRKVDLVIYLHSGLERIFQNIVKRNRDFEKNLSKEYVEHLYNLYNNYFFRYSKTPLLIIDSNDIDFVEKEEDFEDLFKVVFAQDRGFIEYYTPTGKKND